MKPAILLTICLLLSGCSKVKNFQDMIKLDACIDKYGSKPKTEIDFYYYRKGYSGCGICGATWALNKEHTIMYDQGGAFPICEKCFRNASLQEIDEAIDNLVNDWKCQGKVYGEKRKYDKDAELMKIQVRKERNLK